MRKNQRKSHTQGYNCQTVVDTDGSQLIVGRRVTDCASDTRAARS